MEEYGGRRGNLVFHPIYYGTIYLGEGTSFWKSIDNGESYDLLHDFSGQTRYLDISYFNTTQSASLIKTESCYSRISG